jgi:hypothetical protein
MKTMRIFKLNERISVVCDSAKTRNGFKHVATLLVDGQERDKAKICYLNRTWESYEYQSVLQKIISDTDYLSDEERAAACEYAKQDHTDWSGFRSVAMVARMGEVLCDSQKAKNDWKKRMINAGMPQLDMPDDWESLDEDTKQRRLDAVIATMEAN